MVDRVDLINDEIEQEVEDDLLNHTGVEAQNEIDQGIDPAILQLPVDGSFPVNPSIPSAAPITPNLGVDFIRNDILQRQGTDNPSDIAAQDPVNFIRADILSRQDGNNRNNRRTNNTNEVSDFNESPLQFAEGVVSEFGDEDDIDFGEIKKEYIAELKRSFKNSGLSKSQQLGRVLRASSEFDRAGDITGLREINNIQPEVELEQRNEIPEFEEEQGFVDQVRGFFSGGFQRANLNEELQERTGSLVSSVENGITVKSDESLEQFATLLDSRQELGENRAVQRIIESDNYTEAFQRLIEDPSALGAVLLEQYPDLIEETGAQLLGALGGGATGAVVGGGVGSVPAAVIGATGGSAAASFPVVRSNVQRSYFLGQLQSHLAENGLQNTKENIAAFVNSEDGRASLDKANTYANIIAASASGAALVGGGALTSATAKLAGRFGIEVGKKGSKVVVREGVKRAAITSANALGAAGVEIGGEIAASAAVGDDLSPGELLLEIGVSIGEGSVDVATGLVGPAVNRVRNPDPKEPISSNNSPGDRSSPTAALAAISPPISTPAAPNAFADVIAALLTPSRTTTLEPFLPTSIPNRPASFAVALVNAPPPTNAAPDAEAAIIFAYVFALSKEALPSSEFTNAAIFSLVFCNPFSARCDCNWPKK